MQEEITTDWTKILKNAAITGIALIAQGALLAFGSIVAGKVMEKSGAAILLGSNVLPLKRTGT